MVLDVLIKDREVSVSNACSFADFSGQVMSQGGEAAVARLQSRLSVDTKNLAISHMRLASVDEFWLIDQQQGNRFMGGIGITRYPPLTVLNRFFVNYFYHTFMVEAAKYEDTVLVAASVLVDEEYTRRGLGTFLLRNRANLLRFATQQGSSNIPKSEYVFCDYLQPDGLNYLCHNSVEAMLADGFMPAGLANCENEGLYTSYAYRPGTLDLSFLTTKVAVPFSETEARRWVEQGIAYSDIPCADSSAATERAIALLRPHLEFVV